MDVRYWRFTTPIQNQRFSQHFGNGKTQKSYPAHVRFAHDRIATDTEPRRQIVWSCAINTEVIRLKISIDSFRHSNTALDNFSVLKKIKWLSLIDFFFIGANITVHTCSL